MRVKYELIITSKQRRLAPGRCAGCGCTEMDACEGGCGWADDGKTLCTRCLTRLDGIPDDPDLDHLPNVIKLITVPP